MLISNSLEEFKFILWPQLPFKLSLCVNEILLNGAAGVELPDGESSLFVFSFGCIGRVVCQKEKGRGNVDLALDDGGQCSANLFTWHPHIFTISSFYFN